LQQTADDVLDIEDVIGKRIVDTRLIPRITIREENAIAALEVMSRYAVDPKWLIYLPPTMSPSETSKLPDLLEHPQEAFAYYRHEGVPHVICEQKHMGSRAVVIVCRNESVSVKRFGVIEPALGVVYTRTGRRFFSDASLEREFLERVQKAVTMSRLALPGLRVDAVVGQSAGAAACAIRANRHGGDSCACCFKAST
jgi:protein phosphatase